MWEPEIEFVNEEHRKIYGQTKDIPGWQAPGDTERLYEMGYKSGDVILEIGTYAGKSATVELRGALANPQRSAPLYFGIDINPVGVVRTLTNLQAQNLFEHALVFHHDLEQFTSEFDIQPTMVFLDGDHRYDGVKKDLEILKSFLVPDVPVLCHDYTNAQNDTGELGVRRAVDEFVAEGWARFVGTNGCSAFLVTTEKCTGANRSPWTKEQFDARKTELAWPCSIQLYRQLEYRENELKALKKELEQASAAAMSPVG